MKADGEIKIEKQWLRSGKNQFAIVATPLLKRQPWESVNMDAGLIQIFTPAAMWKRTLFNGLAHVLVQSTGQPVQIVLTASGANLSPAIIRIQTTKQ